MATKETQNKDLYQQFLRLLGQKRNGSVRDFREHLLSQRILNHRIGFRRHNLETAFSANLTRLFPNLTGVDERGINDHSPVLMYGAILDDMAKSHDSTKSLLPHVAPDHPIIFFEMGFLASTTSWSEALSSRDPKQACLGYVFDDRAQYYMSDYETRLDEKLNSDFELSKEERVRAERVMGRIVASRISKYNSQPFFRPSVSPGFPRRILVVDQNYSDASTFYGRASDQEFSEMLKSAINENPDAEILIKTHPDINWSKGGKRHGYFDHIKPSERVRIVRDSVNPFELFDLVDKVYVGTSGMGFEALLAGKHVVCFGAPFYAGWGLTDDRVSVPHRQRTRDLAELFYAFYIWYTIYHLPEGDVPSEIEDVLDYIEANRPVRPIPALVSPEPLLSIVIPVHGVERYVGECLASIQRQTFQDFEVILIDDVSQDRSIEIINGYCERDTRFRLLHLEENVGPGFARNHGIEKAHGRYILFIDPDDYMPDQNHLTRVVKMAEEDSAEMVRYRKRFEQVQDEDGTIEQMRKDKTEAYFPHEIRKSSIAQYPQIAHSRHFWNWLYRRDFLNKNGIRFLTTYREERAFLLQAYMADPVISLCDSDGVVYRIRKNSAVRRNQSMNDVKDQLQNFNLVVHQLKNSGSLEPDSPHRWLACFQVSQFLHYLYFGFAWKTAKAANEETVFIDQLAETLNEAGMGPRDLINEPSQLSRTHLRAEAYGLLLMATRLKRRDLIDIALTLRPVSADYLYQEFLKEPSDVLEEELQYALNRYARNERVVLSRPAFAPTNPRPRLIIHLGATKTGSTFIQHILDSNRPKLLRRGIWYPEVGLFWQADRPHKQAGHAQFIEEAKQGGHRLREHLLAGLETLHGRIHTIILSSEAFFLNPQSHKLAQHFFDFDPELIVYLRRQDEWANSQYSEFVAGGAINSTSLSFKKWIATSRAKALMDYDGLIKRWESYLPRNAIHIRRYLRQPGGEWNILTDFSEATNLPQISELTATIGRIANDARLSSVHVELIRQFNKRDFPHKGAYLDFIEKASSRLVAWRQENNLPMYAPWFLNDNVADHIMTTVEVGNDRIARDYFSLRARELFPSRSASPKECSLHLVEFDIVEAAYAEVKSRSKTRGRYSTGQRLVNYGVFSWRLWSSVPLFATVYRFRGRPDLAKELRRNPAEFARSHWNLRRPILRWLTYSKSDVLGPKKILRVWLPVLTPLVRILRSKAAAEKFTNDPVLFVRNLRSPVARLVGRFLFPSGERG
ncbi:glycosyltransferase [Paracoccus sp. (in: a-proteobacteria)]|uniref:glycosyltransferase n=1 Tax=Paracoccus sp. TaxID=267 RepID=UPI002AFEECD6|nr:glycosyltransferase [Paracoccus sp. (in: a-proteobacteria)]